MKRAATMTTTMSATAAEIKRAVQQISRHPRFAAMITLLIVLAIAGNAAVFRVYDGLFLSPLPYEQSARLINLDETAPAWNLEYTGLSFADFARWRRENETFAGMAIFTVVGMNAADSGDATRVNMIRSSHDLPKVLHLAPELGRFFSADEDIPNGPAVALVSRTYWENQLGARPDILGSAIKLGGRTFEIIGVFPESVKAVANGDVWTPLGEDENSRTGYYLAGIGRLRDDVTIEQAGADLTRIHKSIVDSRPVNDITSPVLQSVADRFLGNMKQGAVALQVSTAILLLIACANIAALMLARYLDRSNEFGIRMAIGSSRARLMRQLLAESLVLGFIGGTFGTVLGYAASELLVSAIAPRFPAFVAFDLDWRFMAFIVIATLLSTVAFAVLPALSAARTSPGEVLSKSGARASDSRNRLRSMNALVAAEIALTLALLITGGIVVTDVSRLLDADPGFDTENLLTYSFAMPPADFATPEDRASFINEHLERIRNLPGVDAAAAASSLPLSGHWGWTFRVEGIEPPGAGESDPVVLMRIVSDEYFPTMGIELVSGRSFAAGDYAGSSDSVIINEAFSRTFFPGDMNPRGRRIRPLFDDQTPWLTIVGVARDVQHYGLDQQMRPGVYRPMSAFSRLQALIAVRTSVSPLSIVPAVRDDLRTHNDELSLFNIETMQNRFDSALWARSASSWLIAAFSGVALLLAVAGIYGVISHSVRRREHEFCIRMALGAVFANILGRVIRQGLLVAVTGIAVGIVLMLFAARAVSSVIVTTSAMDPLIYAGAALVLLLAAAAACIAPALRLRNLRPGGAFRAE